MKRQKANSLENIIRKTKTWKRKRSIKKQNNAKICLRGMGSAPHFPTPTTVPTGAQTVFFALSPQNQDVGLQTVYFCVKPHSLFYLFLRLWYNQHVNVLLLIEGKLLICYSCLSYFLLISSSQR